MRPLLVTMLLPSLALAAPIQLTHSGRLLDPAGEALDEPVTLQIGVHAAASGGTPLWTDSASLTPQQGYYTVLLGADPVDNPLDDTLFDGSARYLSVAVDGVGELGARQLLTTVPSAVHATNLSGGAVDATRVSVEGPLDAVSARLGELSMTGSLNLGTPDGTTCSTRGALRVDPTFLTLQMCSGDVWVTVSESASAGTTSQAPGTTCKDLHAEFPDYPSGAYWLKPAGYTGAPFQTWCDMETLDGGWTLVGKVTGAAHNADGGVLDSADQARWIQRSYIGDASNLDNAVALSPAYESVPFTDFLFVGLVNSDAKLGWRHDTTFPSLYSVFSDSTTHIAQSLLIGDFRSLQRRSGCSVGAGPNSTGPQFYGFNIRSDGHGSPNGSLVNGYSTGWCASLAGWGRTNTQATYEGGGLGSICQGRTHQLGRHYWNMGDGCNQATWNAQSNFQVFEGHAFFVR